MRTVCGHCDQSHLAVVPRDSLCTQDKYNHISLKNNIACNPKGQFCLASLLHESRWESDLPGPRPHELAEGQAQTPQTHFFFAVPQSGCPRGALRAPTDTCASAPEFPICEIGTDHLKRSHHPLQNCEKRTIFGSIFEDDRDITEACTALKKKNHFV